jgi:protein SCO1/2
VSFIGVLVWAIPVLALAASTTQMEGLVVEVERAQGVVVVAHGPAGSMPAMTMPFRVSRASQLDGVAPGNRIRFKLARGGRISEILIVKADFGEGVRIPEPASKLRIGDPVPNFELVDQDGRRVQLSDSKGSLTVVNFIYTRCPMPDVCPRLAADFAYLARKAPSVRLLTISLDPEYDTPPVLREYASRFNVRLEHWRFLTGAESRIHEIGGLFGLVYWPEEGVITHTSSTAVIGADGRLAALVEGTRYRADQLLALVTSFQR